MTRHLKPRSNGLATEAQLRDLLHALGPRIHGLALRWTRDAALAEEITQDVFVRAWNARDRFDPAQGTVEAWLYAIARNRIIDSDRSAIARPERPVHPVPDHYCEPDPSEAVLRQLTVATALTRLHPDQRDLVEQVFLQGHTPGEIAQTQGERAGTIRKRLHDAMTVLRRHAEQDHL